MQGGKGSDEPITDINVTPLVDICLVLVIIFMVTVPVMMVVSPLKVDLPEARTIEAREDVNITVALDPEGRIAVDEKEGTIEELPQLLKAAFEKKGDRMVIIRADKDVYHGQVLQIMDLVKRLGGTRMSVATIRKEK
ncbi:MAG: biopolymer transporter ExbD [candidate division WOR-3 bacterium]